MMNYPQSTTTTPTRFLSNIKTIFFLLLFEKFNLDLISKLVLKLEAIALALSLSLFWSVFTFLFYNKN